MAQSAPPRDAVIVQAAVTGSLVDRSTNPNVPITTDEIVVASLDSWHAGASIVHLHARAEDGTPTQDVERFRPVVEAGLEDNSYYHRGVYAESNAQLVERLVRIAGEVGRPVATPEEARQILGLRGR